MTSDTTTSNSDKPLVVILGPTAGGKTGLSLELCQQLPGGGECVIADSMQIYAGMDIGTASPTAEEQAIAPHHLLDIVEPSTDGFSVADWCKASEDAITDIRGRNRWPIVVGGTNLYIRSLLEGVFDGPAADSAIRQELETYTPEELRSKLEASDPSSAERIHPNDRRRTIRALEVLAITGKRLSEQQAEWGASITPRKDAQIVGLEWSPEAINRRINARVKMMMEHGFLNEVRALHERCTPGTQAKEAVGYRELALHIEGKCSLDDAVEQIKIRSRRYAKQQRTWLRRFRAIPGALWLDAEEESSESLAKITVAKIGHLGG